MNLSTQIFDPTLYTYDDYKLWQGDWELIQGHPQAMSPSPLIEHHDFSGEFFAQVNLLLKACNKVCNCKVFFEMDWIISDDTVVRPDGMLVCGEMEKKGHVTIPPILILEVASNSTRLRDRNTKFKLYEMCGVKYYIVADPQKKSVEVFELTDNKYKQTDTTTFILTRDCSIILDVFNLWL